VTTSVDPVFLDTNVLVAASVAEHPAHPVADALLARLVDTGARACVSPQVCREFLATMTRGPVEGIRFEVALAVEVLSAWLGECALIEESSAVVTELVALVVRKGVRGKQVHDANVVATMFANGVTRLATLDEADFRRYEDLVALEPVAS
jgi:predicted nucleic acid-binding protein